MNQKKYKREIVDPTYNTLMDLKFTDLVPHSKGTFGAVFSALVKDDKKIALKKQSVKADEGVSGWVMREIDVMQRMDHPNIMKLDHVFWDSQDIWMGMQWFDFSLKKFIRQHPWSIRQRYLKKLVESLVSGISALHDHGIIHYDIKTDNILIDVREDQVDIKVIDFGICDPGLGINDKNESCTLNYRPPELLSHPGKSGIFLPDRVDVWSLGCVLAEYVVGKRIFDGNETSEVIAKIAEQYGISACKKIGIDTKKRCKNRKIVANRTSMKKRLRALDSELPQSDIDELFLDLVTVLLELDYNKRPSMNAVRDHPYLSDCVFKEANIQSDYEWTHKGYVKEDSSFNSEDRKLILEWLKGVCEFTNMPDLVFFSSVHLFDSFLSKPPRDINVDLIQAQKYALSCFSIAADYHMVNSSPDLSMYLPICLNMITLEEIKMGQNLILTTLDWKIGTRHPYIMLALTDQVDSQQLFKILCSKEYLQLSYDQIVDKMIEE